MAQHIDSVKQSGIKTVTPEEFYTELQWGDLIFTAGNAPISKGIQMVTGSPFSHVLMAWLPSGANQWLTLESTIDRGVHVGKLADYVSGYNGDIVLTRRQLTDEQKHAVLNAGFDVLELAYDWIQEASIVANKLISALPVIKPQREYYCSGLQWHMSLAAPPPLQMPGLSLPTPEDLYTDPSVTAIAALVK